MITNETIIKVLNQLEKEYSGDKYKDNGREFIYRLAMKLINTEDDDRKCVIEFFLNQIELESSDYRSTALLTIEKMRAIELAPRLEEIYYKWHHVRTDEWSYVLVKALIFIGYKNFTYSSFFTEFKYKDQGWIFYLAVFYYQIEPIKGLQILAERYLHDELNIETCWFRSDMEFIIANSTSALLYDLVSKVETLDEKGGQRFRQIMIAGLKEYGDRMMREEKVRQVILDLSNNNF